MSTHVRSSFFLTDDGEFWIGAYDELNEGDFIWESTQDTICFANWDIDISKKLFEVVHEIKVFVPYMLALFPYFHVQLSKIIII